MKRQAIAIFLPFLPHKKKSLWLIAIAYVLLSPYTQAEDPFNTPPYMAWQLVEQRKTSDESMLTRLFLNMPSGYATDQAVEVWYQVTPWQRKVSEFKEGPPFFYTKTLTPVKNGFSLDIKSGGSEKIVLWAKTQINGRPAVAQTLFYSFGHSGHADYEARRIDPVVEENAFDISFDKRFYRVQTGEPISLRLNNSRESNTTVLIFENGRALDVALSAGSDGGYEYTPPHRDSLSKRGFSAKEDLVFVADLKEAGIVSLYLPLYRSLYGHLSLSWGLLIAFCSAAFCLWLIKRADKRFKETLKKYKPTFSVVQVFNQRFKRLKWQ